MNRVIYNRNNKTYYGFVLLLYLFLLRDPIERKLPFFGYFDELLALVAIPVILLKLLNKTGLVISKKRSDYWRFLIITLFSGIIGNFLYQYQPFFGAALPDILLFLKFWLWIEVGRYLFRHFDIEFHAKRIYRHVAIITWAYIALVVADNLVHIFPASIRVGFRSTQLFYFHSTSFASCVIFLMAVLLLIKSGIDQRKFYLYEILLSVLACTSLRSKILGSVLIFWVILYIVFLRKKGITIRTFLLFIPPLLFVGWDKIQYYFLSNVVDGSARYQLLTKSIMIANDHFPIGAGFSSFASYYSGLYYSPLYSRYGISGVYGITSNNTSFISDSFWPMILAQTGYIGLIGYGIALYKLYRKIHSVRQMSIMAYAAGIFIFVYMLVESTSSAAFVHPIYLPAAFVLAYVLNKTGLQKTSGTFNQNNMKKQE